MGRSVRVAVFLCVPGHEIEKRYGVAEAETWAVPVLLGSDLLVCDATGLMRLSVGAWLIHKRHLLMPGAGRLVAKKKDVAFLDGKNGQRLA